MPLSKAARAAVRGSLSVPPSTKGLRSTCELGNALPPHTHIGYKRRRNSHAMMKELPFAVTSPAW